jgi:hypothetical protein
MKIESGTFENKSGVFHLVDANDFEYKNDLQLKVTNVAKGTWYGEAAFENEHCIRLDLYHVDHLEESPGFEVEFDETPIAVDSAFIKVIDSDMKDKKFSERFDPIRTIPGGIVAQTGFGDGIYFADLIKEKDGSVIGLSISFIEDEEIISE